MNDHSYWQHKLCFNDITNNTSFVDVEHTFHLNIDHFIPPLINGIIHVVLFRDLPLFIFPILLTFFFHSFYNYNNFNPDIFIHSTVLFIMASTIPFACSRESFPSLTNKEASRQHHIIVISQNKILGELDKKLCQL